MSPTSIKRIALLSLGLCLSLLSGCREKKPPAAVPPKASAPAAKPTSPSVDDDPMNWPIVVKIGSDGRALPVKTSSLPAQDDRSNMAAHPLQWLTGSPGRYIQAKGSYFRQPFKTIDRSPSHGHGPAQLGGGRSHGVKPDGGRREFDGDTGNFWDWPAGGGASVWNQTEGTFTYRDPGGNVSQTDGLDGDTTSSNGDGSFDSRNKDGSGAHLFPPGEPGPGGATGYSYGPDGPGGERTYFYGDDPGDSVDLPAPTYGGGSGPGGDRLAGGVGEPHFQTRDGTGYTTQAAGEFILVTGIPGREVQARHEPWNGSESFSAITAMAFRVGDSRVEIRLDGTVLLDGIPAPDGPLVQGDIPGGGAVGVWRKAGAMAAAVVLWPDLSAIWLTPRRGWMDFHIQWRGDAPEHRGLLGSNDGDAANDLSDRDGKVATETDDAAVAAFVNSWRVTDAESLFTYKAGESTASFTLADFPRQPPEAKHTALAEECCGHLPEGFAKQRCIYDVSMTGDRSFADSYNDFERRHKAFAAVAPSGKPKPGAPVVIQVEEAELAGATEIAPDAVIKETLAAGQSKLLRFTVVNTNSAPVAIFSEELQPGKKYSPDQPGYAMFNEKREPIGGSTSAANELNFDQLKPGTYYLKIVGPGLVHIKLH